MTEPVSERGKRLAALSARLRVLHSELTEQAPEMRGEQLRDEVQRAVSAMPPQEREGFLTDLLEQFPVWGTPGAAAAPAAPVAVAAPEVKDPRVLAERLMDAARGMAEHERAAIAQRLAAAGFGLVQVKEAPGGLPAGPLAEFKKAVGIPAEQSVDPGRVVELAALLSEFVLKLEPWACSYWRELASEPKNSVYQVHNKDFGKFVSGDEKLSKEALHKSLYKLRSLISLLMKTATEAGKQFARDHLQRFSLEAIGGAAAKGGAFKNQAICNWEQYAKLMEGLDVAAVEKRFKQVIAKDVDAGLSQVIR